MTTADKIGTKARAHLAQELGTPVENIIIQSIEHVDWPDASLGAPEPGYMYAQMITSGYRIRLQHGTIIHEYHSDASGGTLRYVRGV